MKKLLTLCAILLTSHANAYPKINLNGYGTLAYTHSDIEWGEFRRNPDQDTGVGGADKNSFIIDSVLAAQLDVEFTDSFSSKVQAVSRDTYDNGTDPSLEWAYFLYRKLDFSLKVGKFITPIFENSNYKNIGFAQTWIRPPSNLYTIAPVSSVNGAEISYNIFSNESYYTFSVNYGKSRNDLVYDNIHIENLDYEGVGLSAQLEHEYHTIRASYWRAKTQFDPSSGSTPELLDAITKLALAGAPVFGLEIIRNPIEEKNVLRYYSVSYTFNNSDYIIQAEYINRVTDKNGFKDALGDYILLGKIYKPFTFYAIYSEITAPETSTITHLDAATLPAELVGYAEKVNMLSDVSLGDFSSTGMSAGVRVDFYENFDLKFQVDKLSKPEGTPGFTYVNCSYPYATESGSVFVYSAALDFAF